MPTPRPHILILMPDQMRADCLGAAGNPVIRTPALDRLCGEGVLFTNAFTVSPLCMPARASFVSGLYPHNHHMWANAGRLPAEDETLFHHLQKAGYYTAHIGKSHYYSHLAGEHLRTYESYMRARGLDYVHEPTGPWATSRTDSYMTDHWERLGLLAAFREDYERRRRSRPSGVWPSPLPTEEFMDSYIGRQAVRFIDEYSSPEPMCLFVGFGGPHEPWDAPGEYATMYDPAEVPAPIPAAEPPDYLPEYARQRMRFGRVEGLTEEATRELKANYYGKISLVDHWVGEIVAALERRGWLDETLVVFWSDHGELAGDHGRLYKRSYHVGSVRVPLIVRWPGRVPAGAASPALAEIIDVYPTLLEAVGAEPSQRCFGRSLWPVLEDPSAPHRHAVLSEVDYKPYLDTMIRTERFKCAVDQQGRAFMLYDVQNDPQEQTNLLGHPDYADVEREMRELLLSRLLATEYKQR